MYSSIRNGSSKALHAHILIKERFNHTSVLIPLIKPQSNVKTNGTLYTKRRSHITANHNLVSPSLSSSSSVFLFKSQSRHYPFYLSFAAYSFATSLRHHSCHHLRQLPPRHSSSLSKFRLCLNTTIVNMGSINCKEYVTTSDACASQPENGTTGSGSYHQSTCESPTTTKMSEDEYTAPVTVCNIKDLQENEMRPFDFDENTKVLVIKQKDKIKAIGNKCSHYGAPLHTGVLGDGRVRCPWHGACFNIDTGDIEDFPGLDSLPCYKVDIQPNGHVMVRAKRKDLESTRRIKTMAKRDPKNDLCYVIVGGGPSSAVCAETLRQEGFTGRIVMICKEDYLPYDRVKLSKITDPDIAAIQLRKPEFYEEHSIETIVGVSATKMDCPEKTISLSNGWVMKFDKAFIGTGSSPNRPEIKGSDLKGVTVLREYDDAKEIHKYATAESNLVCLGSSFIALEAAQCWAKKVKSVTVVARNSIPLLASFGEVIGKRIHQLFIDQGVNMIMNSGITEIIGDVNSKVCEVVLLDGTKLPCDVLIMGLGSKLNTDFLIGSGLPVNHNGSVETDMYLKSLVDDIYIGGDIANAPVFSLNNQHTVIGHYQLAQYHGRIAGINMVGKRQVEIRAVPFFFTQLFGKSYRYSGFGRYTDVMIDGDVDELKFVAYYIDDAGKVVAVASCGRDPIVAQFAELQSQGRLLRHYELENPSNPSAWTRKLMNPSKCI